MLLDVWVYFWKRKNNGREERRRGGALGNAI